MKVRDMVRHKSNPKSVPCQVVGIKDLGHGKGFEWVTINLMNLLERYYAMNELVVVKEK